MAYRLGGRNSLPYLGVEAPTPSNTVLNKRSPISTDSQNFNIGTWWLRTDTQNSADELWLLISLVGGVATWVQLYPSNAGGASQFIEDVGVANEAAGVINVIGGADASGNTNINTFGSGNTVEVILNETIQWSNTTSGLGAGAIFLGGNRFMHNFGALSTFLGSGAGPTTNSSTGNTGIGTESLTAITVLGENNTTLGSGSGIGLTDGSSNLLLGFAAGSNYTVENDNITLSNLGTVADNGVIRIGSVLQTDCYITGIYNATITTPARMMLIDSNDKLGGATITSTDGSLTITQGVNTINFSVNSSGGAMGDSFVAVVAPTSEVLPAVVGTHTEFVGTYQAMVVLYDDFGTFNPGPIAGGAFFTVPVDGKYNFVWTCLLNALNPTTVDNVQLYVNGNLIFSTVGIQTAGTQTKGAVVLNTTLELASGDIIKFALEFFASTLNQFTIVGGNPGGIGPYRSWVTGTLLKTV